MNSRFNQEFIKLLILELGFVIVVFVAVTILRYFNSQLVEEVIAVFDEYINTELSLSIVLDGK